MWRKIRGAGLAYGYYIAANVNDGMLSLRLYRSSHPVKAYKVAKEIIVRLHLKPLMWRYKPLCFAGRRHFLRGKLEPD